MSHSTCRDVKRLLTVLCCLCAGFPVLLQLCLHLTLGAFSWIALGVSFLFSASVLACVRRYFARQRRMLDDATAQLDRFAAGDAHARIESDTEGSFARLFHAVNQITTMLCAGAEQAQLQKQFLQNTISDISHQLKTPLAALEIYIALLQDESENPAAVTAFAEKSEKEIERMETLVQSLLKITRLDSGSIRMNKQTENVADLMREIRSHFEVRAAREQKQLLLSGPEDATVLCDRVWLMEAVSNLVKNALDHTDAGDQVELAWRALPSATRIVVKDTGEGIHPEDVHHIFKRFYRSRFSKDTQGLGLGLPLVKSIVEMHDGTMEVDSALGKGSQFTMIFLQLTKV